MKHWIEDPRMHAVPAGLKALMAYATGVHFLVLRQHKQAKQCFQFALTLDSSGQGVSPLDISWLPRISRLTVSRQCLRAA